MERVAATAKGVMPSMWLISVHIQPSTSAGGGRVLISLSEVLQWLITITKSSNRHQIIIATSASSQYPSIDSQVCRCLLQLGSHAGESPLSPGQGVRSADVFHKWGHIQENHLCPYDRVKSKAAVITYRRIT